MTKVQTKEPAVGQIWRHLPSESQARIRAPLGAGRGFWTTGPVTLYLDGPHENLGEWEFVSDLPEITDIVAQGPCSACQGTGKGRKRCSGDLDGNNT